MSGDIVAGRHGRPPQPLEEVPQEYAAFKVEQRGIELIPDAERKMRPSGLFWLWSGAVFNVEFFFYGTLIMIFGLSVPQAIAAILIGNLFYVLLGFASLQGPKTGTTAFMVSRAPFGQNGNRPVALFNWITQVGGRRATGSTGVTAASTGRPSSPRRSAWSPRCCGSMRPPRSRPTAARSPTTSPA